MKRVVISLILALCLALPLGTVVLAKPPDHTPPTEWLEELDLDGDSEADYYYFVTDATPRNRKFPHYISVSYLSLPPWQDLVGSLVGKEIWIDGVIILDTFEPWTYPYFPYLLPE